MISSPSRAPSWFGRARSSTRRRPAVFASTPAKQRTPFAFGTMIELLARRSSRPNRQARTAEFFRSAPTISRRQRSACHGTTPGSSCPRTSRPAFSRRTRSCRSTTAGTGALVRMAVESGRAARQRDQVGRVRRARRGRREHCVLPRIRCRLRELQPVPRPRRPPRGGAGGATRALRRAAGRARRREPTLSRYERITR